MKPNRRQALKSLVTALLAAPALGRRGGPRPASDVEAFLRAVRAGDLPAVRAALADDADLARARDDDGLSAFVHAQLAGRTGVADVLLGAGLELDVVEAVLAEDWKRVEVLFEADPECANRCYPIGGTPLYAAALGGRGELYRLRALGCLSDAMPAGGTGLSPAGAAVRCADPLRGWLAATDILSNGGDVNAPQRSGDSVLHGAVTRRDERLVRLALRKGANVDARDAGGRTPLALARELAWSEGVSLLADHTSVPRDHRASQFKYDANRELVRFPDMSDVPQALQSEVTGSSHARLARVRELVSKDPRLVFSISTDAELAIEACGHTGNKEIMRYHLDHGSPLSLPTAISIGEVEHARFLLEEDPLLIHERGPHDFALMWYSAINGDSVHLAELLLEFGTPVDQESLGATALHWCVLRDRRDLAKWLVEHGADLEAVSYRSNRAGRTPLQLARERDRDAIAKTLVDGGAKV